MKILRAEHLGMCFGVRDAIALAVESARHEPLTVLGDLVHNEAVLADMRRQGIRFEAHSAAVTTRNVMITAHGASDRAIAETRRQGFNVMEATCPLVHLAHRSLHKLVAADLHPEWFREDDTIGLTAGTSTPDYLINEIEQAIQLACKVKHESCLA